MTDENAQENARGWLSDAVVYQVYPRSFKDSTGSGLGDIRGVTEKVGYLKELGVDAIWLSPFYPSPLADGGYDVADYCNVDPRLGTMDDFDELARTAHAAGLKIVVDIVPNHCSNEHPWFKEALAAGPGSPERERFIFRDGLGPDGSQPPTDWEAAFGGPMWTRVSDGQWYFHMFTVEQPDFNWDHPDVHQLFLDTLRFWSDHGADGFRIDVAHGLAKDLDREDLASWSPSPVVYRCGESPIWDRNEVHEIYREWRRLFNEYEPPRSAVAEAWVLPERQHLYASPDELGQTFNFEFAKANWCYEEMYQAIHDGIEVARKSESAATWVVSNHDVPRSATRYALPQARTAHYHQLALDWLLRNGTSYSEDRELGLKRSRAALLLEMALPGAAYVYQGEELGLFEVADIPWDECEDPTAFNSARDRVGKGRDGCRVPLPWKGARVDAEGSGFGFSPAHGADGAPAAKPHLPQPDWFGDYSAEAEDADPGSMLNFYRRALEIRHELRHADNDLEWLAMNGPSGKRDGAEGMEGGVVAYRRDNGWACVCNFGADAVALPQGKLLLASGPLDDGKLPQDTAVWLMQS